MARYRGPKNRLARRESIDLGLKTVGSLGHTQLLRRLNVAPGQHGSRGRKKVSEFGLQLREKQRAKRIYGILEKQFRKYFEKARKTHGATGTMLLQLLERRLDNVVYRLGFVPTRNAARQLVTHGHIVVNEKKVSIPSYQVRTDELIGVKQKSLEIPIVKKLLEEKNITIPAWLSRQGPIGKITRLPTRDDIGSDLNEQLIVEFYSR